MMITNIIRVLPSYPRFTLISAFYPHICVLPSYSRFTLIFAFYPHIRVLLSHPRFAISSTFYSHIRVLPSRPSVHPYPRFTLTHVFITCLCKNPGHESWKDLGRSRMILEDRAKILFLPRSCHEVAKIVNINISRVKSWQDWLICLARFQNNCRVIFAICCEDVRDLVMILPRSYIILQCSLSSPCYHLTKIVIDLAKNLPRSVHDLITIFARFYHVHLAPYAIWSFTNVLIIFVTISSRKWPYAMIFHDVAIICHL